MQTVSNEDVVHIAKLANLNIKEEEIEEYRKNLQDILNFANTINSVNTDNVNETIGSSNSMNVFREDEIKDYKDKDILLDNAPEKDKNMFKIPKVIQ